QLPCLLLCLLSLVSLSHSSYRPVSPHTPLLSPLTSHSCLFFFFFNDTPTPEIYTLSLHDALPISPCPISPGCQWWRGRLWASARSEEHTSELQSLTNLVCRLLLEKKKSKSAWTDAG